MRELLEQWKEEVEKFTGDKALFWAGRMSIAAGMVIHSLPCRISENVWLLGMCKTEYDHIIFSRTK